MKRARLFNPGLADMGRRLAGLPPIPPTPIAVSTSSRSGSEGMHTSSRACPRTAPVPPPPGTVADRIPIAAVHKCSPQSRATAAPLSGPPGNGAAFYSDAGELFDVPEFSRRAATRFADPLELPVGGKTVMLLKLVAEHDRADPSKVVSDLIAARADAIGIARLARNDFHVLTPKAPDGAFAKANDGRSPLRPGGPMEGGP